MRFRFFKQRWIRCRLGAASRSSLAPDRAVGRGGAASAAALPAARRPSEVLGLDGPFEQFPSVRNQQENP